MDRIEKLLKEIKGDSSIWEDPKGRPIRISGKFLNNVGEIFEQHGFGATKVYLANQSGRDRSRAHSLLNVLQKMEVYQEIRNHRGLGRYIIKTLEVLKRMEV